jgi:hypothetical protein
MVKSEDPNSIGFAARRTSNADVSLIRGLMLRIGRRDGRLVCTVEEIGKYRSSKSFELSPLPLFTNLSVIHCFNIC